MTISLLSYLCELWSLFLFYFLNVSCTLLSDHAFIKSLWHNVISIYPNFNQNFDPTYYFALNYFISFFAMPCMQEFLNLITALIFDFSPLFLSTELVWRCILQKQVEKVFAVVLGCISAAVLLAEATMLTSGVDLSLFSILVKSVGSDEVLVQVKKQLLWSVS